MTRWSYDPEVDAVDIDIAGRDAHIEYPVKTVDLAGAHVLLDVDASGQVISVEVLGPARHTVTNETIGLDELRLELYLNEEANK